MRRWTFRISICLLLGAVSTIAVAWTLALTMPTVDGAAWSMLPVGPERTRWVIRAARDLGALDIRASADWESDWSGGWGIDKFDESQLPGWSGAAHPPTPDEVEALTILYEHARGWPMLALYWRGMLAPSWHGMLAPSWRTEWGWEIKLLRCFTENQESRTLPLAVIWPGVVIDTVVYGVLWFALLFGFGATRAARRALRTRRGHCPMCAYDLRGDLDAGCSECGWGREEEEQ